MSERILVFICRGHARRDAANLSGQGKAEMLRSALRCAIFELNAENWAVLTSPTADERESASLFARQNQLDQPIVISWLNDTNIQTHLLVGGFKDFLVKNNAVIIVEKPVLEEIVRFCRLPSHEIQSGDTYVLRYPHGHLEHFVSVV